MNALATTSSNPATQLARSDFQIWRKVEGTRQCISFPAIRCFSSLAHVESYLSDSAWHKMFFIVLETDVVTERRTQHIYTVRKGAWQGRFDDKGVKQYPYRAECLASFEVISFEPALRWSCTRDADVIGGDGVVNIKSGASA
jgi:hypothetical protein